MTTLEIPEHSKTTILDSIAQKQDNTIPQKDDNNYSPTKKTILLKSKSPILLKSKSPMPRDLNRVEPRDPIMLLRSIPSKSNNEEIIINKNGAIVTYYDQYLSTTDANSLFEELMTHGKFTRDILNMHGKLTPMPRQVCIFGNEGFGYSFYSNQRKAIPWTPILLQLKLRIESIVECKYNFALITYYKDGNEYIGWHSDRKKNSRTGEGAWNNLTTIASISLGAKRTFELRQNTTNRIHRIDLSHGSLLLMKGLTQQLYKHSLPKQEQINKDRINITFRCSDY